MMEGFVGGAAFFAAKAADGAKASIVVAVANARKAIVALVSLIFIPLFLCPGALSALNTPEVYHGG